MFTKKINAIRKVKHSRTELGEVQHWRDEEVTD
jgi:hypothetical protein